MALVRLHPPLLENTSKGSRAKKREEKGKLPGKEHK